MSFLRRLGHVINRRIPFPVCFGHQARVVVVVVGGYVGGSGEAQGAPFAAFCCHLLERRASF